MGTATPVLDLFAAEIARERCCSKCQRTGLLYPGVLCECVTAKEALAKVSRKKIPVKSKGD